MQATYFDGHSSVPIRVDASFDGVNLVIVGEQLSQRFTLNEIKVSEALGNLPASVLLPNGARLEGPIGAKLARLTGGGNSFHRIADFAERRWSLVLGSLVLLALATFVFINHGVPAIASRLAYALPAELEQGMGQQGSYLMDRIMHPSELPADRQAEIKQLFEAIVTANEAAADFQLHFRRGGSLGANAFSLPSGIVFITDELILISEVDAELEAVLAHEAGHALQKHSLRMLLQDAGTAAVLVALMGDIASISGFAASLPTVLVQAKYSREFEREADTFAFAHLRSRGLDPDHLYNLLQRINPQSGNEEGVESYFSSHPGNRERREQQN